MNSVLYSVYVDIDEVFEELSYKQKVKFFRKHISEFSSNDILAEFTKTELFDELSDNDLYEECERRGVI